MAKAKTGTTGTAAISDEIRKLASLKTDPRNARRHSEAQIAQIITSIEKFGYVEKAIIRPDGQIIGGHARIEALRRIQREDVECRVVAGLSETGYAALGLALNKIGDNSSFDEDILTEVLRGLQGDGEDLTDLGFSTSEIDKLFKEQDPLEVQEIETGPVDDEFWISLRGPLAQQANVMKALNEALKQFAGVSIEQGTINLG